MLPLLNPRVIVACLNFFYWYCFMVDVHLNQQNWFNFLILVGGSLIVWLDCMVFLSISRCYKDFYINSFFPCTVKLWNSQPAEYFPLTSNLNSLELIGSYYLQVLSKHLSCLLLIFSSSFSCSSMPCSGSLVLHGMN